MNIPTEVLGEYKRKMLIKDHAHSRYSANLKFLLLEQFCLQKKGKEREMQSSQTDKLICIPSLGKGQFPNSDLWI